MQFAEPADDVGGAELHAAAAKYFTGEPYDPTGPESAADYRDKKMAAVIFSVDAEAATGQPALSLPVGAAEEGVPASIQIVGRAGDDALVLAAGRMLEAALGAV